MKNTTSNKCKIIDTEIKKKRVQPNGYIHHDKIIIKSQEEGYTNVSTITAEIDVEIITIDAVDHDNFVIISFAELEAIYNFCKDIS